MGTKKLPAGPPAGFDKVVKAFHANDPTAMLDALKEIQKREVKELEEDEEHEHEDRGDTGCARCESMGLCPHCGSASPWRCGCDNGE